MEAIPQNDDGDQGGGQLELTEMGTKSSGGYRDDPVDNDNEFNYRPAVRRQNCCFGMGFTCFAVAAAVYFVAGAYFITGEAGAVDGYDEGSGEVGEDADNGKMQQYLDTEMEETLDGAKGKWKNGQRIKGAKHPWSPWGKNRGDRPFGPKNHRPMGGGNMLGKHNLNKVHQVYQNLTMLEGAGTPGPDGICRLKNGRKIPCPNAERPFANHFNPNKIIPSPAPTSPVGVDWWVDPRPHDKVSLADGIKYQVLEELQHDHHSFTQGLTYGNGLLYESVGLYKKSKIRQLDPKTGAVLKTVYMDGKYFAEGMTYFDEDKLIQITWKSRQGFIYNASTLETISEYKFTTTLNEGWGITFDPRDRTLIVSDGSEYLHFWDPDNPGVDKKERVRVVRQNPDDSARELNELEFVNGRVIANVWYKDILLVINPETGECEDEYDLADLWPKHDRRKEHADVLNGVSVSGEDGILYVTGKLWKKMFRLTLK